jgi:hypothetical protein
LFDSPELLEPCASLAGAPAQPAKPLAMTAAISTIETVLINVHFFIFSPYPFLF